MRHGQAEQATLLAKKRLGKNQKARLAKLTEHLAAQKIPPASPPTVVTGRRGDYQGNTFTKHYRTPPGVVREALPIKPMRSRIQRTRRKRKTGGVR